MARLGTNEVIVDIDCDEIRELTWIKTGQHHTIVVCPILFGTFFRHYIYEFA